MYGNFWLWVSVLARMERIRHGQPPVTRLAFLVSGSGSNLSAIIDYFDGPGSQAPATVILVASDRATAGTLDRAARRSIATATLVDPADDRTVLDMLAVHRVDVIALAERSFRL